MSLPNVFEWSGSVHFFFLYMGHTFSFLCMPHNFSLKNWTFWILQYDNYGNLILPPCWGLLLLVVIVAYLFSDFFELLSKSEFFVVCVH